LDDVQLKFDEKMEASVEAVVATPGMLKEKVSEVPATLKEKVSEMPTVLMEKAKGLNWRQRYHLRSIKTFKVNGKSGMFEKLRKEIKDKR
jgi:hypothetical protein